jgi:hypothetical protein
LGAVAVAAADSPQYAVGRDKCINAEVHWLE